MPLGRRTDCGDAKVAGLELAFLSADPDTEVEVSTICPLLLHSATVELQLKMLIVTTGRVPMRF